MEDNIDFDFSSIDHITSSLAAFSFQIIEKKEGFKSHDYEAPQIYADMTSYYNSQMNFECNKQTDVTSTIHKLDHMYDHFMTSLKDNGEKPNIKNKNIYLGDPKSQPTKKRSLSLNKRKEAKSNGQDKKNNAKISEGKNMKKKEIDWEEGRTEDEVSRSFSTDRYEYPKMDEGWLYLPVYEGKPCPKNAVGGGKGWGGDGRSNNNVNNNNNNNQYYYGQNQAKMNNFGWNYEKNWGGYYPPYNFYNPAAARFQPNGQNQLL